MALTLWVGTSRIDAAAIEQQGWMEPFLWPALWLEVIPRLLIKSL